MSNLNDNNSQNTKMYSNGILTSLLLPKKRSNGCVWFRINFYFYKWTYTNTVKLCCKWGWFERNEKTISV